MPVNAFGYNRPRWGLHYCPWDPFCREIGAATKDVMAPGTGGVAPWFYIHTPWGSLIIPISLDRGQWPAGSWWLKHRG
jgi:hypothetical protein